MLENKKILCYYKDKNSEMYELFNKCADRTNSTTSGSKLIQMDNKPLPLVVRYLTAEPTCMYAGSTLPERENGITGFLF